MAAMTTRTAERSDMRISPWLRSPFVSSLLIRRGPDPSHLNVAESGDAAGEAGVDAQAGEHVVGRRRGVDGHVGERGLAVNRYGEARAVDADAEHDRAVDRQVRLRVLPVALGDDDLIRDRDRGDGPPLAVPPVRVDRGDRRLGALPALHGRAQLVRRPQL